MDYKISSIKRLGNRTTVIVRFYDGDYETIDGKRTYHRTNVHESRVVLFRGDVGDDDIRLYLNSKPAEFPGTHIPEQRSSKEPIILPAVDRKIV